MGAAASPLARAADAPPACRSPAAVERSAASIYADEDPQGVLPPDEAPPDDSNGRWTPPDESASPFDSDEDEEFQV